MDHNLSLQETQKEWHGSLSDYVIGFIISLVLTTASFTLVIMRPLTGSNLVYLLVGLAIIQAICQLIFFLHAGQEAKPKWESIIFYFMVMVLLILALGSLWIMNDLNDRVMSDMPSMEASHD